MAGKQKSIGKMGLSFSSAERVETRFKKVSGCKAEPYFTSGIVERPHHRSMRKANKPAEVSKSASKGFPSLNLHKHLEEEEPSPVYELLQQMERKSTLLRKTDLKARARKRMLGLTSHDLLSPINAISGYLDLMKLSLSSDADPAQLSRYRDQIKNAVNDLTSIVHLVREMSRLEKDEEDLSVPFDVDLNWIVRDVCDVMEGAVMAKQHDLSCIYLDKPAFVNVDLPQLKRVLYNLISNSIKYTPRGGEIEVRLCTVGDMGRVMVKDNGIGIPREDFANIFKPNRKLRNAKTENEDSSGLGLYISAHYAKLMNGHISLESETSKGSCFTLHLPLSEHHPYPCSTNGTLDGSPS